jgi:hypothetical protein
MRWVMVAPSWLLMSSPTIGNPAAAKRSAQTGSEAMNTGMQFTKPQPACSACSA